MKAAAAIGIAVGLAACAAVPRFAIPAGEVPLMTVAAQGTQVYECRADGAAAPVWAFVAPEAELFDAQGRRIGRHGAGPVWQHADGSGFVGTVRERVPAPRADAIPWLLLTARSQGPDGVFARVTSVARVNTVGGTAPADGCSTATLGTRAAIAYRADYALYGPGR